MTNAGAHVEIVDQDISDDTEPPVPTVRRRLKGVLSDDSITEHLTNGALRLDGNVVRLGRASPDRDTPRDHVKWASTPCIVITA